MLNSDSAHMSSSGFNTASGMDCMQFVPLVRKGDILVVSIPQAVWIACNRSIMESIIDQGVRFQYRKRYGLHAM